MLLMDPAEDMIPSLTATWNDVDGQRSLRVSGELDIATAPRLAAALQGEIRPGTSVTLDLADLAFIDAAGLRVLVAVSRTVGPAGRVLLRRPSSIVQRVLAVAGLTASISQ